VLYIILIKCYVHITIFLEINDLHAPRFHNFRHSEAMIEKLRKAGLGYNVNDSETTDKFGLSFLKVFNFFLYLALENFF